MSRGLPPFSPSLSSLSSLSVSCARALARARTERGALLSPSLPLSLLSLLSLSRARARWHARAPREMEKGKAVSRALPTHSPSLSSLSSLSLSRGRRQQGAGLLSAEACSRFRHRKQPRAAAALHPIGHSLSRPWGGGLNKTGAKSRPPPEIEIRPPPWFRRRLFGHCRASALGPVPLVPISRRPAGSGAVAGGARRHMPDARRALLPCRDSSAALSPGLRAGTHKLRASAALSFCSKCGQGGPGGRAALAGECGVRCRRPAASGRTCWAASVRLDHARGRSSTRLGTPLPTPAAASHISPSLPPSLPPSFPPSLSLLPSLSTALVTTLCQYGASNFSLPPTPLLPSSPSRSHSSSSRERRERGITGHSTLFCGAELQLQL